MSYKTTIPSTILALVLLSGCAVQAPEARPREESRGADGPEAHAPAARFADTVDLSSATEVGIGTTLDSDPSVLTVAVPGQPGDYTFELTEEQCSLRLVQVAASAVDVEFTDDDVDNSIMVTVIFHGVESPVQRPDLEWSVNKGEGALGAHSSLFVDAAGGQTLTLSRGVGSISQLFYSELTCAPGVDTVDVYTRSVAPRVWINAK